jgi:hypothetical protein
MPGEWLAGGKALPPRFPIRENCINFNPFYYLGTKMMFRDFLPIWQRAYDGLFSGNWELSWDINSSDVF